MLTCIMNPSHCIREITAGACATALLCTAVGASAQQAMYRHLDANGHSVYTDRPELPPPAEVAVEPDSPSVQGRSTSSRRSYPHVNASEAQRRLVQSQQKRTQGKTPLPGERAQESGALTYAYWRRQEKLRIEVEQAQRRANAVQQPLLAGASKM